MRLFLAVFILAFVCSCSHPQKMLDAQDNYRTVETPIVTQIAEGLIADTSSERDKAESVFLWLLDNVRYAEDGPTTVSAVLEKRTANSLGYSALFQALAEAAGLESRVISGKSKGYSYLPNSLHEHSWNAVKVDGEWQLLDVTWGTGYYDLTGAFSEAKNLQWFLTPAEAFSYFNYPQDLNDLLLSHPLTESEFQSRPRLVPGFFDLALSFEQDDIHSVKVESSLITKLRSGKGALLKSRVRPLKGSFLPGVAEIDNDAGVATFKLDFPQKGEYEVQIRAKLADESTSRYVGSYYVEATKDPEPVATRTPEPNQSPRLTPTPKSETAQEPGSRTKAIASRPIAPPPVTIDHYDVARAAVEITKAASNDREKAHALYRWLAENISYDTDSFFNKKNTEYPDQDAKAVLKRRDAVCAGYSELFHEMAAAVGLESKIVSGYTRGDDYDPKRTFTETDHAWNAVKIDGKWQLLDATWGAGSVDDKTQKFTRKPHDGWFLPPPEVFVQTHLPEDKKWQLLESEVTPQQFNQLPRMNARFVKYGFRLAEPNKGIYQTSGQLKITILSQQSAILSAELEDESGARIKRSVLVNKGSGTYEVFVRVPQKGLYELLLFAKEPGEEKGVNVGTLLIQSSAGSKPEFPIVYSNFGENGCALLQGYDGRTKSGLSSYYEVKLPNTSEVYITQESERTPMNKVGDSYSANFTPKPGEFGIVGKFAEGNMFVLMYQAE
jgi:transglutaminase-like putative cysteine protease